MKKLLITCLILFPNIALGATKYTKESSEYAIRYVFGDKAETFIKIAHCESGLNNLAINKNDAKITGHPSWGLLQVNGQLGQDDYLFHPYNNAKEAKKIFEKQGFRAWANCSKSLGLIKSG